MKRWRSSKNKYFLCLVLFLLATVASFLLSPRSVSAASYNDYIEAKGCWQYNGLPLSESRKHCIPKWCKGASPMNCEAAKKFMDEYEQGTADDDNRVTAMMNRICSQIDSKPVFIINQCESGDILKDLKEAYSMCKETEGSVAQCMAEELGKINAGYNSYTNLENDISQGSQDHADQDAEHNAQQNCEMWQGGKWDDTANKCILPNADEDAQTTDVKCRQSILNLGWTLCPGASILSRGIDKVMTLIDNQMTFTVLADKGDTMKGIWQSFLNIANIAFVIVFLIMIYSMATSLNTAVSPKSSLSNYGIKQLLPRLIICAVAINLSFYICAAAVDLSNIAGKGIYGLFMGMVPHGNALTIFENVVTSVFQLAAMAFIAILCLGTILPIVILACLSILAAIIFRQVALVVMVVISPVAIVCYLLPNTQKWATKWQDLFIKLLLVYPMFMAVWGGSRLVSYLETQSPDSSNVAGVIAQIVVPSFCAVAPAFAIMPLFRASGGLMQMATNGIQKFADKNKLQDRIANTGANRAVMRFNGNAARAYRNVQFSTPKIRIPLGRSGRGITIGGSFGLPGRNSQGMLSTATDEKVNEFDKKVAEASDGFVGKLTSDQRKSILTTGKYKGSNVDSYTYEAAFRASGEDLSYQEADEALIASNNIASNMNEQDARRVRSATVAGLRKAKAGLGGQLLRDYEAGKFNGVDNRVLRDQIQQQRITSAGSYSANRLSEMPSYQLKYLYDQITAGQNSDNPTLQVAANRSAKQLGNTARSILGNDNLKTNLNQEGSGYIESFAKFANPSLGAHAAAAGSSNAGNYGQDRFGGTGSQTGSASSGVAQSDPVTSRTVDQNKVKQWASEGAVDLNNPEAVKQAQSGRRGAGNNSPVDGTTPYGDKPYYDAKGQVPGANQEKS